MRKGKTSAAMPLRFPFSLSRRSSSSFKLCCSAFHCSSVTPPVDAYASSSLRRSLSRRSISMAMSCRSLKSAASCRAYFASTSFLSAYSWAKDLLSDSTPLSSRRTLLYKISYVSFPLSTSRASLMLLCCSPRKYSAIFSPSKK